MSILLLGGLVFFVTMVILLNIPNQVGIQGFTWIYFPNPLGAILLYRLIFDDSPERPDPIRFADNALLMIMLAFFTFSSTMGISCI